MLPLHKSTANQHQYFVWQMEQETEQQEGGKGGIWYDGRGQNEQLKFIDMQKFTSFWFGFCNLGKTDSVPVSVSIRAARMVELRKLLPFLGLLFLFAICLCDFLLLLSLPLLHSLTLSFSLSCWLLFWLANNKRKLLLSQKFLTYKFSCFLACCSDCSLSWR